MKKNTFYVLLLLFSYFSYGQQILDEDFNNATIPTGWISLSTTGTAEWAFGANGQFMTQSAVFQNNSNVQNGAEFYSPQINTNVTNDVYLSFQHYLNSGNLVVSVWNGSAFIEVLNTSADTGIVFNAINISAYKNVNCQLKFAFSDAAGANGFAGIDNVKVEENNTVPSCPEVTAPLNEDENVQLTSSIEWTPTSGIADGYKISIGTTAGGTDIENLKDLGTGTSYALNSLVAGTEYFVTVIAYNSTGNSTSCSELSFTTVAPVTPGTDCENPIVIGNSSLPYVNTGNTSSYGDDYNGNPGDGCTTSNYLSGDDVVYSFTPSNTGFYNFKLSSLSANYAGVFIFDSCSNIGTNCLNGATNSFSSNDIEIIEQELTVGTTYYVVISTWAAPQSVGYTLTVEEVLCPDVNNITVNNITLNSVTLGWDEIVTATDGYQWVVMNDGEEPDTTTAAATGTTAAGVNTVTVNGLTQATTYTVYVRSNCGTDALGNWVSGGDFTTECSSLTAPYSEAFSENLPNCWSLQSSGENWQFANTPGSNHIGNDGTITGATESGGYYAWVDDSTPDSGDSSLISPFIDISELEVPALYFYEISHNEGDNNPNSTLTVEYTTDGTTWEELSSYNGNTNGWELRIIGLGNIDTINPIQFRFVFIGSSEFYDDIAIDDFKVDEAPDCYAPSSIVLTPSSNSVEVNFEDYNNPDAPGYFIEFVELGNQPTESGDFVNNISGTGLPYTKTGLSPQTTYSVYLQTICNSGNSDWVGPFNVTTTCQIYDQDYTFDFGDGLDDCWSEATGPITDGPSGTTSSWVEDTFLNDGATPAYKINLYSLGPDTDWLITPYFDLTNLNKLEFDMGLTDWNQTTLTDNLNPDDKLIVLINNGSGWTPLETIQGNAYAWQDTGETKIYNLSGFEGQVVQFAFYTSEDVSSTTGRDVDLFVSNFKVSYDTSILAIEDYEISKNTKVYPNPAEDIVTIKSEETIVKIEVYDLLGRKVSTYNSVENIINVSRLKTGIYIAKMYTSDKKVIVKRIIKK